jgi:hypothetical protein
MPVGSSAESSAGVRPVDIHSTNFAPKNSRTPVDFIGRDGYRRVAGLRVDTARSLARNYVEGLDRPRRALERRRHSVLFFSFERNSRQAGK